MMIQQFINLFGNVGNTYQEITVYFGCIIVVIFICTSMLQFIASLFKR